MTFKSTNITWVEHGVSLENRWNRHNHKGGVIWLTGLSGSGKSTLATLLECDLFNRGYEVFVLDGDNVRHGLCSDLGFSKVDRTENIRRIGELAALYAEAGLIVITAFISPYRADRRAARKISGGNFHEIHLSASVEQCEERDPKGLYHKAREGKILDFTGISAPYELPEKPELEIATGTLSVEKSLDLFTDYVIDQFRL